MILRNLIQELNTIIPRASDYDVTNVAGVDYSGGFITFECGQEEIEKLKSDIKDNEGVINGLESDLKNRDADIDKLGARINELESELSNFVSDKEGAALDLIARAKNAEVSELNCRKTLQDIKGIYKEMEIDNQKLRARKDKATVTRCINTGKLIAEFNGVKYFMEEKK